MKCPTAGYPGDISHIPTLSCALASKPKVGAGCGKAASPDLCGVGRGNPPSYRDSCSENLNCCPPRAGPGAVDQIGVLSIFLDNYLENPA